MKNQTRNSIISLVFIALYAAMAIALEQVSKLIPFLQMPQGGSIELGIIPIFMASYHLGFKKGLATSLIWWLLGFLLGGNNWFVSVPQYLLDYIGHYSSAHWLPQCLKSARFPTFIPVL